MVPSRLRYRSGSNGVSSVCTKVPTQLKSAAVHVGVVSLLLRRNASLKRECSCSMDGNVGLHAGMLTNAS